MTKAIIKPSSLRGNITIPSSKSHTIRALLFALMAKGKSRIALPLVSPDTLAMLDAIRKVGAKTEISPTELIIEGVAGELKPTEDIIQCGNSGLVLRFIGAIAALSSSYTILTGDQSIRKNRLVAPLLGALNQLGAFATSARLDDYAPIIVKGPLKTNKAILTGEDSQPVSALLMLGAFFPLEIEVINPGEKPWIHLTLSWLDRFNIPYENHNFEKYKLKGGSALSSFDYKVPGDFSSAAFPIAAALVTNSEITLENIDLKDVQGDKVIIKILESMGARFEYDHNRLTVQKGFALTGSRIDINDLIDALPILAVVGCFASGQTEIINGAIARKKESDRIHCIVTELKKMGADIEERPDGLIVRTSSLHGSKDLSAHHDHRLGMALAVAALGANGKSVIDGVECIAKSYPSFFDDFRKIGAQL